MAATIEAMAYEALITNTALVAKLAKKSWDALLLLSIESVLL